MRRGGAMGVAVSVAVVVAVIVGNHADTLYYNITTAKAINALTHDPEKACPDLMRGVQRFSEKIMRKQESRAR
jgi:hypothetical protein